MEQLRIRKFDGLLRAGNEDNQSFETARECDGVAFDEGILSTFSLKLTPVSAKKCVLYEHFPLATNMLQKNPAVTYRLDDHLFEVYQGAVFTVKVDGIELGTIEGTTFRAWAELGRVLLATDKGMWYVQLSMEGQNPALFPVLSRSKDGITILQESRTSEIDGSQIYARPVPFAWSTNESGTMIYTYLFVLCSFNGTIYPGSDTRDKFKTQLRASREWRFYSLQETFTGIALTTESATFNNNETAFLAYLDSFVPSGWAYKGKSEKNGYIYVQTNSETSTVGQVEFQTPIDYVLTEVVDNYYEVPIRHDTLELTFSQRFTSKFMIKFGLSQEMITGNVTGYRLYIRKWKNKTTFFEQDVYGDYEQIASYNGLETVHLARTNGLYGQMDPNGIYLSQVLGYSFSSNIMPISVIKDYIDVNGLYFALSENNVYFSVVGNGNIQPFIFHRDTIIPNITSKPITKLTNINGSLGVFTEHELYIIASQDIGGTYVHSIKDIIGYGVRDFYDVCTSPDAVATNTSHGIYVTNGSSSKIINEQLHAEMVLDYQSLNIFYSNLRKELYVHNIVPDSVGRHRTYVYNFTYQYWTVLYVTGRINNISEFGEDTFFLLDDVCCKAEFSKNGDGFYRTPDTLLQAEEIFKLPSSISFDAVGTLTLFGRKYDTRGERLAFTVAIPVALRKPVRRIGFAMGLKDATVYSLVFNYQIVGEKPAYGQSIPPR